MLCNLHVKNFAIIDEVWLDFGSGLNVLSGETGAGKSLLIGSLNAALGGRISKDILGNSGDFALVELTFNDKSDALKILFDELMLDFNDGEIILSRKISSSGKSVCRINGETVTAQILKQVAEVLIDIHGQNDHQSLLYEANQREILDSFIPGGEKELACVKACYKEYTKACKELEEAETSGRLSEKEIDLLNYEHDEIDAACLKPGEDEELEARVKVLKVSDKILSAINFVGESLVNGQNNASDVLDEALRAISKVSGEDKVLSDAYDTINTINDSINDVVKSLQDFADEINGSEEEFSEAVSRLDIINHLKSKFGNTIEAVLEYRDDIERTLEKQADYDKYIEKLEKNAETARISLNDAASRLSSVRKAVADELSPMIEERIKELNMENAKFEIELDKKDNITENGAESISFMISTNLGEPLRALNKIASGGEMSRIMLAIKEVLAKKSSIDSLVFDEIDVGISGKTAWKVSEAMGRLARNHQIICITHLPQIAAMADTSILIAKGMKGDSVKTSLSVLSSEEKIKEIARMVGADKITDSAILNAREIDNLASEFKKTLN